MGFLAGNLTEKIRLSETCQPLDLRYRQNGSKAHGSILYFALVYTQFLAENVETMLKHGEGEVEICRDIG